MIRKELAYTNVNENQKEKLQFLKETASELLNAIDEVCPDSREKSLSKTKIEEAIMWASKSISHNK